MSRPSLVTLCLAVAGLLVLTAAVPASAAVTTAQSSMKVSVPASTTPGKLIAVTLTLPENVAAVDGRLLVAKGAAQLVGVAPIAGGTGLMPEAVNGGYAFGAYALKAVSGHAIVQLVVDPLKAGKLQFRILIDATANKAGVRLGASSSVVANLRVRGASRVFAAPSAASVAALSATRPAGAVRKLIGFGKINSQDLDAVRLSWDEARAQSKVCGSDLYGDANGDGCVDIVDLQAVKAAIGTRAVNAIQPKLPAASIAAAPSNLTLTVNTTADTVDANIGDGICADSQGMCSLRAAIQEADWHQGDDRIEFNIPASFPAVIQIGSSLPMITSKKGTLTIDGYTQPGSRANTASTGSNALIGVEVRGGGSGASQVAFRITSFDNILRGLAISDVWRGIVLDGVNAHDNQIIGDWIGFRATGDNSSSGADGILLNTGANNNLVGTSDLADVNVIGNMTKAIYSYGPGTDNNVIQDNVLCIRPDGGTATCATGIDHDFGPKNELAGGTDTNEKNVIGPTTLQAVEYSHGWNPNLAPRVDNSLTWQIDGNQLIGNWLGFRADGSYDPSYRSGLNFSTADNAEGINVYDGSNSNMIQGNYIASVYDGIQVMAPNAKYNVFSGNVIGVSPLGQPAPLTGWGVKVRWQTTYDVIGGNTIRNAALGGVGLVNTDNNGVAQAVAYNIEITQNIITDTSGPAIYLAPVQGNPTTGANTLLASPVITNATTALVNGTGIKGATVELYHATRAAGASGLPDAYLGSAVVNANGRWSWQVGGLVAGDRVTATQTRTTDATTSSLSVNVTVVDAPPPDPRIVADDFERTSSSGWGTAVVGGTWAVSGTASSYTISSGAGHIDAPAGVTREAVLSPDVPAANLTVTGSVNFDRIPAGGNAFAYVDARRTGKSAYRAEIRIATTGKIYLQIREAAATGVETAVAPEVFTGVTATPSTVLDFRFTLVGGHLQARVWDASTSEPSTWQTEVDDTTITAAGGVALRALAGAPVTNGSVIVSFDNLLANPAP